MSNLPEWFYQKYIAHRGYFNEDFPENSLGAFTRAIENDFAIEMDVQILRDDSLIVFHDENLKRMTGLDRSVASCVYDEIKPLRLKNTVEIIPTFKEMLELVDGRVPLMIEFKNSTKNNMLEMKAYEMLKGYNGPYLIQSFNPNSLLWFKKNAPAVIRGQLSCRHNDGDLGFLSRFLMRNVMTNIITKPDFVIYDIKALDTWIIKWLKLFKMPLYGYTAKSADQYHQALAKGVKSVFEGFDPRNL